MLIPISLRSKLFFIFLAMFSIVLVCSISMVWNSRQVSSRLSDVMQKDLALYEITREMELALANQKGYLTYYFVDGDELWLESLASYQRQFQESLDHALSFDVDAQQAGSLHKIKSEYEEYLLAKDTAIEEYRSTGASRFISGTHERQRDLFFNLLAACRSFSTHQWGLIADARERAVQSARQLVVTAIWQLLAFIALCGLFILVLYRQLLAPIRNLAVETAGGTADKPLNDVASLSNSFKGIMKDIDETHSELERSRRNLIQAERMAVVGELAAGVAHTIRNPLTSMKMRVFSLARSLNMKREQNEDLQVISGEIERIDKIVSNFIEFARPPKLRFEEHSLEELTRSVCELMKFRLKNHQVDIEYDFTPGLSKVMLDGDRLREALLNLLTNSCEAMLSGGTIRITETREHDPQLGELAVLSIHDDGPGIPDSIIGKVTDPFFTTKDKGSGLGLSSVARIVQEHGGELVIAPVQAGCEIVIKLPV
jgi:signal transduction histidine kinase